MRKVILFVILLVALAGLLGSTVMAKPGKPCNVHNKHCVPTPTPTRIVSTIIWRSTRIWCFRSPCPGIK